MRKECKGRCWDNICDFLSDPITNPIYSIKRHTLIMLDIPSILKTNKEKNVNIIQ